ncbi:MAG: inorganic pyrophosphatase Ppa [Desulfosarcinaceae bacterium]|nr:inorganic pyrophosphatase Ppa [Desulfosarcinaceae bacterium]
MKPLHYLQETMKFEVQTFRYPGNISQLRQTHVAFSGSPRKHPHDDQKVILVVDPYSRNTFYYELNRDDVAFVEELPNIVNDADETVTVVRAWVRKGSIAVRCTPFRVDDVMPG